jgi:CheY-like chemotaxis protein
MSKLRALVLEDEAKWVDAIRSGLEVIGMSVDVTAEVDNALELVASNHYALVTVDLSLIGMNSDGMPDDEGAKFLERLRAEQQDMSAAVLLVSGRASRGDVSGAFELYGIDAFIDKQDFDERRLTETARANILKARLRAADRCAEAQHELEITFNTTKLLSADLRGPRMNGRIQIDGNATLNNAMFGKRSDELNNFLIHNETEEWRKAASATGRALYDRLTRPPGITERLALVRQASQRSAPTVISFAGPASGLRIPFELLTNGNDYLSLEFVVTRKLTSPGLLPTNKGERFQQFMRDLIRRREPLRILVVGVDTDGTIPGAEAEIKDIVRGLRADLEALGIRHAITTLIGAEASYGRVAESLASTKYHLLHYAGHGEHAVANPERSGVVLGKGVEEMTLTATDLKVLLSQTALRCVFLNCCLGAATQTDAVGGDFHGTVDAIVRADVPFVIGHRWVIPDEQARLFALKFYEGLFTFFSPGLALLWARIAASSEAEGGRDNPIWASPVFVSQAPP